MRLIKTEYIDLFKKRGVPPSVLLAQHPDDITRHINIIEVPRDTGSIVMDKKKQIAAVDLFSRTISAKKPQSAPFMLIASRSYDFIAMQYALSIAASLVVNAGHSFYWHTLYGNTFDKLRDKENPPELKDCHLLILSNVAENSTNMKTEKARDVLNMYSHIPRILAVGGVDPVQYAKQQLHVRPDYYVSC